MSNWQKDSDAASTPSNNKNRNAPENNNIITNLNRKNINKQKNLPTWKKKLQEKLKENKPAASPRQRAEHLINVIENTIITFNQLPANNNSKSKAIAKLISLTNNQDHKQQIGNQRQQNRGANSISGALKPNHD